MLAQKVNLVEDGLVQMAQKKIFGGPFVDRYRKAKHLRVVNQVAMGCLQFEQRRAIE